MAMAHRRDLPGRHQGGYRDYTGAVPVIVAVLDLLEEPTRWR
ncbi:hypothetical protein [Streptomyces sp. H27-H5]|nr:hypothetical protein [Streptomyces sp. H27-H5]MCY0962427.1 hypothetical protein [Streptomyces sp. H27-H5]